MRLIQDTPVLPGTSAERARPAASGLPFCHCKTQKRIFGVSKTHTKRNMLMKNDYFAV